MNRETKNGSNKSSPHSGSLLTTDTHFITISKPLQHAHLWHPATKDAHSYWLSHLGTLLQPYCLKNSLICRTHHRSVAPNLFDVYMNIYE